MKLRSLLVRWKPAGRSLTGTASAITTLLLLLTTSPVFADDAAILRCRALSDSSSRLACYDAISVPATGGTPLQQTPNQFGLDHQTFNEQLQAIESRIEGRFDGWGPQDTIKLANGQLWQITDHSRRMLESINPKVRVRRGALGAYYLEIEGTNHSPRVRRVQ